MLSFAPKARSRNFTRSTDSTASPAAAKIENNAVAARSAEIAAAAANGANDSISSMESSCAFHSASSACFRSRRGTPTPRLQHHARLTEPSGSPSRDASS